MDVRIIDAARDYVDRLFRDNADGHDVGHSMRVLDNALLIAKGEQGCDLGVVALSALLHDVDDPKLFLTRDNAHARGFLTEQGMCAEEVERICEVIDSVSFSRNRGRRPGSLEGEVVQDADRLDAIGAIGVARAFAYGGVHGRSLDSSMQHFHEKLLLLKDEMNTTTARQLAEARHVFMRLFLEELEVEMRGSSE